MKRALLLLVPLAAACAHGPEEIQAWCERYATKHVMYGVHEDPAAYREDLISSCMAMRKLPYQKAQAAATAPTGAAARSTGMSSAR
jgi:hypothetical protein